MSFRLFPIVLVLIMASCTGKQTPLIQQQTPETDATELWCARDNSTMLWGCINRQSEWIIPAKFDFIGQFSCGYAPCFYNGLPAYVSTDGRICRPKGITVDDTYMFQPFFYGYAVVEREVYDANTDEMASGYTMVDTAMNCVFDGEFSYLDNMSAEGLIAVRRFGEELFGYMDITGKQIIPAQYEAATGFSDGLAAVEINGQFGLINTKGEWVVAPAYDYLWWVCENRWAAIRGMDNECLIDGKGKTIIPFGKYNSFQPVKTSCAIISCHKVETDTYGWILPNGNELTDFCFHHTFPFDNDYACAIDSVMSDCFRWNFVDTQGKVIYSSTCEGSYDAEDIYLHNSVLDLRYQLNTLDYAGQLITTQGNTLHTWICHQ